MLCIVSLLVRSWGVLWSELHVPLLDTKNGPELCSGHNSTTSGWAGTRTGWVYACNKRQSGILHDEVHLFLGKKCTSREFISLSKAMDILQVHKNEPPLCGGEGGRAPETSALCAAVSWKSHLLCFPAVCQKQDPPGITCAGAARQLREGTAVWMPHRLRETN